jgi:hypothetical protein
MPCQWTVVASVSQFVSWMLALSPRFARNVGPGKEVLYARTDEDCPPPRSTVAGAAVRAKLLGEGAGGGMRNG